MASNIQLKTYGTRMLIVLDELITGKQITDPVTGRVFTLHTPEVHSERTRTATIMGVGKEAAEEGFKEGDRIVVSWHCGTRLHFIDKAVFGKVWDEDLLRVIRTEEVLASVVALEE